MFFIYLFSVFHKSYSEFSAICVTSLHPNLWYEESTVPLRLRKHDTKSCWEPLQRVYILCIVYNGVHILQSAHTEKYSPWITWLHAPGIFPSKRFPRYVHNTRGERELDIWEYVHSRYIYWQLWKEYVMNLPIYHEDGWLTKYSFDAQIKLVIIEFIACFFKTWVKIIWDRKK